MPRVTVGVPVYNSAALLEQCLQDLAVQTSHDFKVIILDNASIDTTEAVARKFASLDPRFTYVRQSSNKGARQNFADALAMADTPYFMWRADDDASSPNYVETLLGLLDATPGAELAVGMTVMDKRGRFRRYSFPKRFRAEHEFVYRARLLMRSRAPWIYGLFRTDALRASIQDVNLSYRHTIGFDHLVLFPFLMQGRVCGTNDALFTTGFIEREVGALRRPGPSPADMKSLRQDFYAFCASRAGRLIGTGPALAMAPILQAYSARTYRWTKIWTERLRKGGALASGPTHSKYD